MSTVAAYEAFDLASATVDDPNSLITSTSQVGNTITIGVSTPAAAYAFLGQGILFYEDLSNIPGYTPPDADGRPTCVIQWRMSAVTSPPNFGVGGYIGRFSQTTGAQAAFRTLNSGNSRAYNATFSSFNDDGSGSDPVRQNLRGTCLAGGKFMSGALSGVAVGTAAKLDNATDAWSNTREQSNLNDLLVPEFGLGIVKPFTFARTGNIVITDFERRAVPFTTGGGGGGGGGAGQGQVLQGRDLQGETLFRQPFVQGRSRR